LYAEGRTANSAGMVPGAFATAAQGFRALVTSPNTLLARLVIKPEFGSAGN